MKTIKRILAAVLALSMAISTLAVAQDRDHRGDRDGNESRGSQRYEQRRDDHRGDGPPRGFEQRGAGPQHDWRRGGRLPPQYHTREYVVSDWRGHHLSAPPRGYHWVQNGTDFVLVAIATGIIAQVLLGR